MMRKKLLTLTAAFLLINVMNASAQIDENTYKENYNKKSNNLVDQARDEASKLSNKVGEMLNMDKPEEDLVKIKGSYYMPLYNVNLYKGNDSEEFRNACHEMFVARYPLAKIISVSIPQTNWTTEWVLKGKAIAGNAQTIYCYIIAKDGDFGYINAKFVFKKYKEEGGELTRLSDSWPKWERLDYLTSEVYSKLLAR